MKKFGSIILSLVLFLSLGTTTFASGTVDNSYDPEIEAALALIESTNLEIEHKIQVAVEKSDKLQQNYLLQMRILEEGKKILPLLKQKEKISSAIEREKNPQKLESLKLALHDIMNNLVSEKKIIDAKMDVVEQEITEITAEYWVPLTDEQKKATKMTADMSMNDYLTARYIRQLERIIDDVYTKTLEMSKNTIAEVAKVGIIAECSWKQVRFADRWIWIDPVRVVRFTKTRY